MGGTDRDYGGREKGVERKGGKIAGSVEISGFRRLAGASLSTFFRPWMVT
jgi:hypothetical protein